MFKGAGPPEYAEKIWVSLTTGAVMTPLDGTVDDDVLLDQVKPRYMAEVAALARPWATPDGLANPYTMLWAVAEKAAADP